MEISLARSAHTVWQRSRPHIINGMLYGMTTEGGTYGQGTVFAGAIELHRDVPRRSAHPCALRNANTNPNADCGSSSEWDGYAAPCSQGALNGTIRCGRFLEEENALPAERTENPRPPRTQHRRGNARPGTSAKRQ